MAEWIDDHGDALAITLFCGGTENDSPRTDCLGKIGIDRAGCEAEELRGEPHENRVWAQRAKVRKHPVGDHDRTFANFELRMTDTTVMWVGQS